MDRQRKNSVKMKENVGKNETERRTSNGGKIAF